MARDKTSTTGSNFVAPLRYTLKASGAETSNTTSGAVEIPDESVGILVNVTATSGTPTMTVVIEGSNDGTNWYTIATFGANGYSLGSLGTAPSNITGTTTVRGSIPCPYLVRSRSVIGGGTPSLTYSVTAG